MSEDMARRVAQVEKYYKSFTITKDLETIKKAMKEYEGEDSRFDAIKSIFDILKKQKPKQLPTVQLDFDWKTIFESFSDFLSDKAIDTNLFLPEKERLKCLEAFREKTKFYKTSHMDQNDTQANPCYFFTIMDETTNTERNFITKSHIKLCDNIWSKFVTSLFVKKRRLADS